MYKSKTPKVDRYRKMLDRLFDRIINFSSLSNKYEIPDHLVVYDTRWYLDQFEKFKKMKAEK